MIERTQFFIDGSWVEPDGSETLDVVNPATEQTVGRITLGNEVDADRAVAAARAAFDSWGQTTAEQRRDYLAAIVEVYERRADELADVLSSEMGAPISLAKRAQARTGLGHLRSFIRALEDYEFVRTPDPSAPEHQEVHEPMGVAVMITPWNWPMNQITLKIGAALAAGCTVVLKPSEISPLSAALLAEFIDEAGLPAGVFNLVQGDGPGIGSALTTNPDVDVISFTGSTRAGRMISAAASANITRVSLELGGKSPNLIFADTDLDAAATYGVMAVMTNTGQSCNAPTRMLIERSVYDDVVEKVVDKASATHVGDPSEEGGHIGPLVSAAQFDKVQHMIQTGIDEGAKLVVGGLGKPEGFETGHFARPTVFADVDNSMTIAQEEIFGPVLVLIPFEDEAEAIEIANDSPYGLAAYVQTSDVDRARRVTRRLRAGMVQINQARRAPLAPFGGYKQSGIGREGGPLGIEEFLEVKAVSGLPAA